MGETLVDVRYPAGKFQRPAIHTQQQRAAFLKELEDAPAQMKDAVAGLTEAQLETPYREGGWTIRQVVHHVADSHMHSYLRCKFAVAEERPLVKPYAEAVWAEYDDAAHGPVEVSLSLLANLHYRWVRWLRTLPEEAFQRTMIHPENGEMPLDMVVALYAWHGRHHIAHIRQGRAVAEKASIPGS